MFQLLQLYHIRERAAGINLKTEFKDKGQKREGKPNQEIPALFTFYLSSFAFLLLPCCLTTERRGRYFVY